MKRMHLLKIFLIIILFVVVGEDLFSTPVFAKKYKTACLTCHVSFAKRNSFGEAFRRNGYVMPMQVQSMIKEQPLKLGADQNHWN